MAKADKRPTAVFNAPKAIGNFIIKCRTILEDVTTNLPTLALPVDISTHIDDLATAETTAQTRVVGAVGTRDLKYNIVLTDMRLLRSVVQDAADQAGSESAAIAIINSSGFDLRVNGVHVKPEMAVKNGKVSGAVILTQKALRGRTSYDWQRSDDNIAWTSLTSTVQAKTTVTGETPGNKVYFRGRAITKDGPQDWKTSVWVFVL
jgi:hypothetical protein